MSISFKNPLLLGNNGAGHASGRLGGKQRERVEHKILETPSLLNTNFHISRTLTAFKLALVPKTMTADTKLSKRWNHFRLKGGNNENRNSICKSCICSNFR